MQMPLNEDAKELTTAVRFRAQDQIPMPLDQAVLDHRVVSKGKGPEGQRQMEVLAVAARRDMVVSLLEALRKAGLRPVGIDLAAFGMIRALNLGPAVPIPAVDGEEGQIQTTILYCYLGDVTNLAVARGGECLFTRVAPFGIENIAQRVARARASRWMTRESLLDVGLEEELEGFDSEFGSTDDDGGAVPARARERRSRRVSKLIDEVRLSLDFYSTQEGASPVERVVVCGPGSTIPGLPERIQVTLGLGIEVMSPAALGELDDEDAARYVSMDWRSETDAPRQPHPARRAPWRPHAAPDWSLHLRARRWARTAPARNRRRRADQQADLRSQVGAAAARAGARRRHRPRAEPAGVR
jgi:type IV pilus assembly protein PilM